MIWLLSTSDPYRYPNDVNFWEEFALGLTQKCICTLGHVSDKFNIESSSVSKSGAKQFGNPFLRKPNTTYSYVSQQFTRLQISATTVVFEGRSISFRILIWSITIILRCCSKFRAFSHSSNAIASNFDYSCQTASELSTALAEAITSGITLSGMNLSERALVCPSRTYGGASRNLRLDTESMTFPVTLLREVVRVNIFPISFYT